MNQGHASKCRVQEKNKEEKQKTWGGENTKNVKVSGKL